MDNTKSSTQPRSGTQPRVSRRNFLLAVGAGGAATAAAVAAKVVPQQEEKQATTEAGTGGYRVSEHVRNYYRTAQV